MRGRPISFFYSLYLPAVRGLYLHIPRTGGTWLMRAANLCGIPQEKWLYPCPSNHGRKHMQFASLHRRLLTKVDFVFTVVRHPVDWYESMWRLLVHTASKKPRMRRRAKVGDWEPTLTHRLEHLDDFSAWLNSLLDVQPSYATRYMEQFVGLERREHCHFIGRTEMLTSDFKELMRVLGYGHMVEGRRKELAELDRNRTSTPKPVWRDGLLDRVWHEDRALIRRFYGQESGKRWYSGMDSRHGKCPWGSPATICELRSQLYPSEGGER